MAFQNPKMSKFPFSFFGVSIKNHAKVMSFACNLSQYELFGLRVPIANLQSLRTNTKHHA